MSTENRSPDQSLAGRGFVVSVMDNPQMEVGEMPKENINSTCVSDNNEAVTRAELSWKIAPGYVQLTTSMLTTSTPEGAPASQHYAEGAYVQLDREGINRMIRSLRKARDAAYGQDA